MIVQGTGVQVYVPFSVYYDSVFFLEKDKNKQR